MRLRAVDRAPRDGWRSITTVSLTPTGPVKRREVVIGSARVVVTARIHVNASQRDRRPKAGAVGNIQARGRLGWSTMRSDDPYATNEWTPARLRPARDRVLTVVEPVWRTLLPPPRIGAYCPARNPDRRRAHGTPDTPPALSCHQSRPTAPLGDPYTTRAAQDKGQRPTTPRASLISSSR